GVQYNALGQPVSWIWSVGNVQYQRSYDAYGRLVSYPLGNPGGSGISAGVTRTIAYDAAGRIVGYSHTTPVNWDQVFGYDGLDRLTGASLQGGNVYSYAYDATGNRTQTSINGTAYADTVSATSNRYSSVSNATGTASQGYDAAGNLTSDAAGTYTYSARGRMSMQTNAGGTFTYLYNGLGQRVYKSGPSSVIATGVAYYAYDTEGRLLGEYDATGKAVYETVYMVDLPVAVLTQPALNQTTVSYAYADHLNTARVLVRPSDKAIVWNWGSAEPFGQSQVDANPSGIGAFAYSSRFPGQVADAESGWFYNWHRDYNAALGRYVQSDPVGLNGGVNTYLYVDALPTLEVDALGLMGAGGGGSTNSSAQHPAPMPAPSPAANCGCDHALQVCRALVNGYNPAMKLASAMIGGGLGKVAGKSNASAGVAGGAAAGIAGDVVESTTGMNRAGLLAGCDAGYKRCVAKCVDCSKK
ncbi:MAG: RHS repeat-associated core domain-containing protein, partial [Vitreoscilla sp.]